MARRSYAVRITEDAERDLESLYDYVAEHRSPENAADLLDAIERKFRSLAEFPERGGVPKELEGLGQGDCRQILLLPYRIVYRLIGDTVFIYLIADGRRDVQALLRRRLLRS